MAEKSIAASRMDRFFIVFGFSLEVEYTFSPQEKLEYYISVTQIELV
jgi:hypothetical protein